MTPQELLDLCDKFCTYIDAIKDKVQAYHDKIVPQVMNETKDNPAPFTNEELYLYKNIAKKFRLGLDVIYSQIYALDHDIDIALNWRKQYVEAEKRKSKPKQETEMTAMEALKILAGKLTEKQIQEIMNVKSGNIK